MSGFLLAAHAARNTVRLGRRTLRLFFVFFFASLLLVAAFVVADCCGRLIDASIGPLEGAFQVELKATRPNAGDALGLAEGFGAVTEVIAHAEYPVYLYGEDEKRTELKGVERTTGDKKLLFPEIDGYYNAAPFQLRAITACETDEDFFSGSYRVTSGRALTQEDSDSLALAALISEAVAAANGVSIGDTLMLRAPAVKQSGNIRDNPSLRVTVVGLVHTETENKSAVWDYSVPENVVYLPVGTAQAFFELLNQDLSQDGGISLPVEKLYIRLKDRSLAEPMTERLSDIFLVSAALTEISPETQTVAVQRVSSFVYATVWILTAILFALTLVLTWQNRKERTEETGILCALGMKKRAISFQFFLENLMTGLLAALLGIVAAAALAYAFGGEVQTWLSESRLVADIRNTSDVSVFTGLAPAVSAAVKSGLSLLSGATVIKVLAILLLAVCCGSALAAAQVGRAEPMALLKRGA